MDLAVKLWYHDFVVVVVNKPEGRLLMLPPS